MGQWIKVLLFGICILLFPTAVQAEPESASVLSAAELSLAVGESEFLTVEGADGSLSLWKSSDEKVAAVTSEGKVTGIGGGEAVVTASVDGQDLECWVRVRSIQMRAAPKAMQRKSTYILKLEQNNIASKVVWRSSDKKIAAVNSKGRVRAKKCGTVTITAKADGCKAVCKIKIVDARLSASDLSLVKGGSKKLGVTGISQKLTWKSSDPSVASVGKKGKVTAKKEGTAVITAAFDAGSLSCAVTVTDPIWNKLKDQYKDKPRVKQLLFVQYTGGTYAKVLLYDKVGKKWKKILACPGYVGSNGIGKTREGDATTPTGTFNFTSGFGILPDPGAKMPYLQVDSSHYWCSDQLYYNKLIDITQVPHDCKGEHLIDYVPSYDYGMFLDYNKKCIYPKGSAIFLHCSGGYTYTGGCIAVSEPDMVKILQTVEKGAKICIYDK